MKEYLYESHLPHILNHIQLSVDLEHIMSLMKQVV